MLKINEVIIVEGKYDAIRLSAIVDAVIIATDGFGIFGDKEKMEMLRHIAKEKGLIILTDSDKAGFKIRSYIEGSINKEYIKNVYIPDVFGKERRKEVFSKEGKLGVEGIDDGILLQCFEKAGITSSKQEKTEKREILKSDLYYDRLCGNENSSFLRERLLKELNLPKGLSPKKMLQILNIFLGFEEYKRMIDKILQ